jgi:hypothetical protein
MIETNTASTKVLQFQILCIFEKSKLPLWKTNEFGKENEIVELCLYILGTKYQFYSVIWTSLLYSHSVNPQKVPWDVEFVHSKV